MHREQWLFLFSALYQKINLLTARPLPPDAQILVVKRDEIGDVANALHVFPFIRQCMPEAQITVWCRKMVVPILKNFEEITYIHCEEEPPKQSFHVYIDLRGNFLSLKQAVLHPRARYLGRGLTRWINKKQGGQKHETDTNTQIVRPLGKGKQHLTELLPSYRYSREEKIRVETWIESHLEQPFMVIHTGSRDPQRRWPSERFSEVCMYLHEKYGLLPLIAGGPDEYDLVERMLNHWPIRAVNVCGVFSINEFAYLCSKSALFIGNDSGPLHLAWISGCPSIGIFGPGAFGLFHPLGAHARTLRHRLAGHHHLGAPVTDITVHEVIDACEELLEQRKSNPERDLNS